LITDLVFDASKFYINIKIIFQLFNFYIRFKLVDLILILRFFSKIKLKFYYNLNDTRIKICILVRKLRLKY